MENKENKVVSNEIERSKMYVNVGMIELTPEMLEKTTDEKIAEIERQKYQLNKEKEQLEEVSEKQLDIEGIETSEDRMAAALTILEKERELQEMREKFANDCTVLGIAAYAEAKEERLTAYYAKWGVTINPDYVLS